MTLPKLKVDPLIVLILSAVALAIVAPIHGAAADAFSIATKIAIAALFFLYGARLSPAEAFAGLKHWRLHSVILSFTFIVFPIIGLLLAPLKGIYGEALYNGILYLTLVPSTVQSSIAFTSIARGNVAGAIVSASASNLLGVVLTPLLVMLLMTGGSTGIHVDGHVFADIALQLLAPFVLGQLSRRWVKDFAASKGTKIVDRGSITMVVYAAFSHGMIEGVWSSVKPLILVQLVVFSIVLVAVMLWLTRAVARLLKFSDEDMKAIQFCGTKKSLATGLPMAAVIFGSNGLGLLILPLMIFHQVQLMMCSALASHYAQTPAPETAKN